MASASATANEGVDPISKALALGSYFLSGCLAINVSQVLGAPLSLINSEWYNSWIAFTRQQFAVLTMTMTQRWAPTVVRVSGDRSVRGQLFQTTTDDLLCLFPKRMVMIANHQIYTDWLYLWWIAYSNGMHGRIYIVLKESLKRIPVIGWGMQLAQFIFLKRNWEQDKPQMATHMKKLDRIEDPMWLLLFPEGTNLAPCTRAASASWAAKNGIQDLRHVLLPRTTGLQFCLQELRGSIGYVYDCTIAYDGVKRGEYAQDVYTLQASYVAGKPPKCVHMYWRRFPISQIPLFDDRRFELWLRTRWIEKDSLIEYFYKHGQFPADTGMEKGPDGRIKRGAGYVNAAIKASKWNDFLQRFMPMGLMAMILFTFYGALPEVFQEAIKNHPLLKNISDLPAVRVQGQEEVPKASTKIPPPMIAAVAPGSQVKSAQAKQAQLAQSNAKKPKKLPTHNQVADSKALPSTMSANQTPAQRLTQLKRTQSAPKLALKLGQPSSATPSVASGPSARSTASARSAPMTGSLRSIASQQSLSKAGSVRSVPSQHSASSVASAPKLRSVASAQSLSSIQTGGSVKSAPSLRSVASSTALTTSSGNSAAPKLAPRRAPPKLSVKMPPAAVAQANGKPPAPKLAIRSTPAKPASVAGSGSSGTYTSGALPKLGPRKPLAPSASPLKSALKSSRSSSMSTMADGVRSPPKRVQIMEAPRAPKATPVRAR